MNNSIKDDQIIQQEAIIDQEIKNLFVVNDDNHGLNKILNEIMELNTNSFTNPTNQLIENSTFEDLSELENFDFEMENAFLNQNHDPMIGTMFQPIY